MLRGRHNLVVTGTHGKTTTTSILTWIFESSGLEPGYLIGGIPSNLGQGSNIRDSKYFILEGDEYDTAFFDKRSKFVHYLPELVIVNNIEFDHADIYRDLDEIKTSFRRLLNIVPSEGMVLINGDDPNCLDVAKNCPAPIVEVGFSANCANQIRNATHTPTGSSFELFNETFSIPLSGDFNIRNAAMAASAAHYYGVPIDKIRSALESFQGIRRRQEVRGTVNGITIIDDSMAATPGKALAALAEGRSKAKDICMSPIASDGDLSIEVCSSCHPFFTGKQVILDTAGQVERFQKRYAAAGKKKK